MRLSISTKVNYGRLGRKIYQPLCRTWQKKRASKKNHCVYSNQSTNERTRRQLKSLRHATNSELLCEAFLHAFTGQPLPTDADLMKERNDEIPEDAKVLMRELGVDPESWEY